MWNIKDVLQTERCQVYRGALSLDKRRMLCGGLNFLRCVYMSLASEAVKLRISSLLWLSCEMAPNRLRWLSIFGHSGGGNVLGDCGTLERCGLASESESLRGGPWDFQLSFPSCLCSWSTEIWTNNLLLPKLPAQPPTQCAPCYNVLLLKPEPKWSLSPEDALSGIWSQRWER